MEYFNNFQQQNKEAEQLVEGVRQVLEQLPREFKIGIDQCVAIERLLITYTFDKGDKPGKLEEIFPFIGPIVCSSPEQQVIFNKIVSSYCLSFIERQPVAPKPEVKIEEPKLPEPTSPTVAEDVDYETNLELKNIAKQSEKSHVGLVLFFAIAILSGVGALMWLSSSPVTMAPIPEDVKLPPQPPLVINISWLITVLPVMTAILVVGWRRRLNRFLERRFVGEQAREEDKINITSLPAEGFGSNTRQRLLPLRTPLEVPSRNLDIDRTINERVRYPNRPLALRFAPRRQSSEYLVFSRQLTTHSHLEYISGALVSAMHRNEINVRHYAFWREGVRLVENRKYRSEGRPDKNLHDLTSLSSRFPEHRLIVVDEAKYLITRRGLPASWTEQFSSWPEKTWITPVPRERWGDGEALALQLGFLVISLCDPDPLANLGSAFTGVLREPEQEELPPYPPCLARSPELFTTEEAPNPEEARTLVEQLKVYLEENGFAWLQACAVFPRLEPVLTQYLGERLINNQKMPLYSVAGLAMLSRLPYFQTGDMPDWLRETLIDEMSPAWREHVRDVVIETLAPPEDKAGIASISVIRRYRRYFIDRIVDKLRTQEGDELLRSQVLIDFLYKKEQLSLRLPHWLFRGWREFITPDSVFILALGLVGSLAIFGLSDDIVKKTITGWIVDTFGKTQGSTFRVSATITTVTLTLSAIGLWLSDLFRQQDSRQSQRSGILMLCGFTLLGSLFCLGDAVISYVLLKSNIEIGFNLFPSAYADVPPKVFNESVQQTTPQILNSWPNMQLLLAVFSLLAIVLRATVAPVVPPRIAAPTLYESFVRIGYGRLLSQIIIVVFALLVVMSPFALNQEITASTTIITTWPYLFALAILKSSILETPQYFIRPIIMMPIVVLAIGLAYKPVFGTWKPVMHMLFAAFIASVAAEWFVEMMFWIDRWTTGPSKVVSVLSMILPSMLCLIAVSLAFYRYHLVSVKPLFVFFLIILFFSVLLIFVFFDTDKKMVQYGVSVYVISLVPLALFVALKIGGERLSIGRSIGYWFGSSMIFSLFSFAVVLSLLVIAGLQSVLFDYEVNGFYFTTTILLAYLIFFPATWLKMVSATAGAQIFNGFLSGFFPESTIKKPAYSATPWLLLFLLPLLTVQFSNSGIRLESYYFIIPLSAWLGYRYDRSGFVALAIGLLPLLFGSPKFGAVSLPLLFDVYIAALFICWVFAFPEGGYRRISQAEISTAGVVAVFLVGAFAFGFKGGFGTIGWQASQILIPVSAFMLGLTSIQAKKFNIVAIVLMIFGVLLSYFNLNTHSEDLGNGLKFYGGHYYDSIPELVIAILLFTFGRYTADALRGSTNAIWQSWHGYTIFAALWILGLHSMQIRGGFFLSIAGSSWLMLALAFIAGMVWQQRGLAILFGVVALSIAEATYMSFIDQVRFAFTIGQSELRLAMPQIGMHSDVFIASLVYAYFGLQVSRALGLAPGLQAATPLPKSWLTSEPEKIKEPKLRSISNPFAPWMLLPLMPLLVMAIRFSKTVGLYFEYLVIPFAAWIAYRYGRNGLYALAVGMITYWVGWVFGKSGLRLSPDLYLMALCVAWIIVYSDRWIEKLQRFRLSTVVVIIVFCLLPIYIKFRLGALSVGWEPYLFVPFVLFLLGWAGAPLRRTMILITVFGIIGVVLLNLKLNISSGALSIRYDLRGVRDILELMIWYLGGLVLHHSYFQQGNSVKSSYKLIDTPTEIANPRLINWIAGNKGYIALGVIMYMSSISISFKFGSISIYLWGASWLLFFGAFIAGYLWRWQGMQLTAGAVAFAGIVTLPVFGNGSLGWESGEFILKIAAMRKSFIFAALTAPLYCYLGIRVAQWRASGGGLRKKTGTPQQEEFASLTEEEFVLHMKEEARENEKLPTFGSLIKEIKGLNSSRPV